MKEGVIVDQDREIPLKWDLEAIHWLQDNVEGTPTLLEATIPYFRWGARVSIHTGLPTVLGWDSHEWLQRWEYRPMIEQRRADVQTIYETADFDLALKAPAAVRCGLHLSGRLGARLLSGPRPGEIRADERI